MNIKKFLKHILLLPIIPIIGVPDGGEGSGGASGGNSSGGNGGEGSGEGEGSSNNNEGKSGNKNDDKTFTQADVDKMLKDRLGREKKKYEKMIEDVKKTILGDGDGANNNNNNDGGQNKPDPEATKAMEKAQSAIAAANQRLVSATATTEAVKLGVDPKYVADVVRLTDLSKIEVKEDGSMDTAAISKAIDDVLKRVPVFKAAQETGGGFRVGGEGNKGTNNNGNGWNTKGQAEAKRWNRFR